MKRFKKWVTLVYILITLFGVFVASDNLFYSLMLPSSKR